MSKLKILPLNRSQAEFAGVARYLDPGEPCSDCGSLSPERYTATGECRNCVREGSMAAFGSDPLDVFGYTEALRRRLPTYFLPNITCSQGPHLKMFSVRNRNHCVICLNDKRAREARDHGPQQHRSPGRPANHVAVDLRTAPVGVSIRDAQGLGFDFYRSAKPCMNGHTAPRYLSGGCLQCAGKWLPEDKRKPVKPRPQPGDHDYNDPNDLPVGLLPGFVPCVPKRAPVSFEPLPPIKYTTHPDGTVTYMPRIEMVRPGEHVVTVSQERRQRRIDAREATEEDEPEITHEEALRQRDALLAATAAQQRVHSPERGRRKG